jgi:hypothetical protein
MIALILGIICGIGAVFASDVVDLLDIVISVIGFDLSVPVVGVLLGGSAFGLILRGVGGLDGGKILGMFGGRG